MRRHLTITLAALSAAALATHVHAQASFTGLGHLPNPVSGYLYSSAWGVSADGTTVVGDSLVSGHIIFGPSYAAFRWTAQTGMVDIYDFGGIGTTCRAYAANADGSLVVGVSNTGTLSPSDENAWFWSPDGITVIGDLPGGPSDGPRGAARGISGDGLVIAGIGESVNGTEPFRYSMVSATFLGLGDLPGGAFSGSGYGISSDGSTIVGSSATDIGTVAFRWTQATGMVSLGVLPYPDGAVPISEAYAANADGSVVVGLTRSNDSGAGGWEAFRWTQATGMVGLGDLPGGSVLSEAYATTPDGSIIVGKGGVLGSVTPFGITTAPHAFIWDAQNGMRDLNTVLPAMGISLGTWVLSEARGISANGRVIVGSGTNPQGLTEAWRVTLPCPADFDGNGQIQPSDVAAFVNTWFISLSNGTLAGDFDHNGAVQPADVAAFISAWFAALTNGC